MPSAPVCSPPTVFAVPAPSAVSPPAALPVRARDDLAHRGLRRSVVGLVLPAVGFGTWPIAMAGGGEAEAVGAVLQLLPWVLSAIAPLVALGGVFLCMAALGGGFPGRGRAITGLVAGVLALGQFCYLLQQFVAVWQSAPWWW
ncbi:hypothetical protein [Blastococcus sp. SYSU D00820]